MLESVVSYQRKRKRSEDVGQDDELGAGAKRVQLGQNSEMTSLVPALEKD
jgi:hypothetical protein